MPACRYVEKNGSAGMLTRKRSTDVIPEVNLGKVYHACLCQVMATLALKPRGDVTRSPNQGYQWSHKKD